MGVTLVLGASLLLQLVAVGLALRLIPVTGRRVTWVLIATALVLMVARRSITFFRLLSGDATLPPDPAAELVALAISALLVAGLASMYPLFRELRENEGRYRTLFEEKSRTDEEYAALERQLQLSQRLEAVGRLAGGIAHDFNNLLTAILSHAQLLQTDLPDDDPRRADLQEIAHAAERAAALTRQLLAFSRKQVLQPRVIDLNAVMTDTQRLLERLIGEDVELRTRLDGELGPVKADPAQVEQVVMNLAVNARDAMPDGGTLILETANAELDDEYVSRHDVVRPGSYAMLAVTDTGTGMSDEILAHIFEPFYTTKEAGKGTGLGLATVYGIVKQSGGYIWVYSEPGRGTSFKIYLPRVDEPLEPARRRERAARAPHGTETVLVVEDDASVRAIAARALRKYGYTVLEGATGEDALRLVERRGDSIHVLLSDTVMPGMSGQELAREVVARRPVIKVLYMSGYAADALTRGLEPGAVLLQKPFTTDALARAVRDALDGS